MDPARSEKSFSRGSARVVSGYPGFTIPYRDAVITSHPRRGRPRASPRARLRRRWTIDPGIHRESYSPPSVPFIPIRRYVGSSFFPTSSSLRRGVKTKRGKIATGTSLSARRAAATEATTEIQCPTLSLSLSLSLSRRFSPPGGNFLHVVRPKERFFSRGRDTKWAAVSSKQPIEAHRSAPLSKGSRQARRSLSSAARAICNRAISGYLVSSNGKSIRYGANYGDRVSACSSLLPPFSSSLSREVSPGIADLYREASAYARV